MAFVISVNVGLRTEEVILLTILFYVMLVLIIVIGLELHAWLFLFRFIEAYHMCLFQIYGYKQLQHEIEVLRKIPYSSENSDHETKLLKVINFHEIYFQQCILQKLNCILNTHL